MTNQQLIDLFFEAYISKDMPALKKVMDENVTWTFLGQHRFAGIKKGLNEVLDFFDIMSNIMGQSKPAVEKLISASDKNYVIECQHIKTHRVDKNNIDHHLCVLWTFENSKIISGQHFFADPQAAERFFDTVDLLDYF